MEGNRMVSIGGFRPSSKSGTISNQVYETIRDHIVNLSIAPGTGMSEKEFADRLHVSRTPVREAFIRLDREGLVRIFPQRGTNVSKISVMRAKEERFLRESIERAVLEQFMNENPPGAAAQLRDNIARQHQALAREDFSGFMRLDDLFHAVFYETIGKTLCSSIVCSCSIDYYRLRFLSLSLSKDVAAQNVQQHADLCDYVEHKQVDKAQALLTVHLRKLFSELKAMQEKYPAYFEEE